MINISRFITIGGSKEIKFSIGKKCVQFDRSANHCKLLSELIKKCYFGLIELDKWKQDVFFEPCGSGADVFKSIILVPTFIKCIKCQSQLLLRNPPSNPLIYTKEGTKVGAAYEGRCEKCQMNYYHSYAIDKTRNEKYFFDHRGKKYFGITSSTFFEREILEEAMINMGISATTFESPAEVYNKLFMEQDREKLSNFSVFCRSRSTDGDCFQMDRIRLEEACFFFEIVNFYRSTGADIWSVPFSTICDDSRNLGHRKNLKSVC